MDGLDELKLILDCIYNESTVGEPLIPFFHLRDCQVQVRRRRLN